MFLAGMRQMLDAMPGESEKGEIQANLDALMEFLVSLRESVRRLPSTEDINQARRSLEAIEETARRAEGKAFLAEALGIRRAGAKRKIDRSLADEEIAAAKSKLGQIETLAIDELRAELLKERAYSIRELRALGTVLGIRSVAKLGREALAHQITVKIANPRGYERLLDHSDEEQS